MGVSLDASMKRGHSGDPSSSSTFDIHCRCMRKWYEPGQARKPIPRSFIAKNLGAGCWLHIWCVGRGNRYIGGVRWRSIAVSGGSVGVYTCIVCERAKSVR